MTSIPDREDLDRVFSLVYEELRRLASGVLRREYAAEITPTTLVNEAWLKLAGTPGVASTSPAHFRGIANRAMRQVLVDAARRRQATINGGGLTRVSLDPSIGTAWVMADRDLIALDSALELLTRSFPRQAQLVEARFFGGFNWLECAEMLEISEATVMREWRAARAWLAREIRHIIGRGTVLPNLISYSND